MRWSCVHSVCCIKADLFCCPSHLSGAHVNSESSHSSKASLTLLCEAITRSCWMRTNTNVVSAIRLGGEFKHSGLTATWLSPRQVCEGVLNVLFLFCCNFIPLEVLKWPQLNLYMHIYFPSFIHMTCKCLFWHFDVRFQVWCWTFTPSRIASVEALTNASTVAWPASKISRDAAWKCHHLRC